MAQAEVGEARILEALKETAAIGSTVRQLAVRLSTIESHVALQLEGLRDRGEALRIGRGLWILRDYRDLASRSDFVDPQMYVERFVRDGGPSPGTYTGPITFSSNDTEPVHRWWPYVQGYSARFVRELVASSELPPSSTVLDPFAGSGTSLVEARRLGHRAVGFEILPVAALAARTKTRFEISPTGLAKAAAETLVRARRRSAGAIPFLTETRRQFASSTLRDLTRLRDALPRPGTGIGDALRVAFGATLIPVSRLRRSPCLGYGPARVGPAPSAFGRFGLTVRQMVEDLELLRRERRSWGPAAQVRVADARSVHLPEESVDLAVTSPPYVNGMDYVMNYKVDLAWLGFASSYSDLDRMRRASVACDNLPRNEAAKFLDVARAPDPWLRAILEEMRANVARKGSYRRDDAHGIVLRYFEDLVPVLRSAYRSLRPGGRFVLVVGDSLLAGTYVPGDLLTARLGAREGFRILAVEVARRRRSGQRRSFSLRESVVTLEKPR